MTASPPLTPPGVITQEFHTPRDVRRGIIAGVAGNVLEWYSAGATVARHRSHAELHTPRLVSR